MRSKKTLLIEPMTAGKFRHLPVVEGNKLIGVISIGDVAKHRAQQIEFESAVLRDYIGTAWSEYSRQPRLGLIRCPDP